MGQIKRKKGETHKGKILSTGKDYFKVIDTRNKYWTYCSRCAFYLPDGHLSDSICLRRKRCDLYYGEYYIKIDEQELVKELKEGVPEEGI